MSANRAQVGDRMLVTFTPNGHALQPDRTEVVTVDKVIRLSCGCDRAEAARPGPPGPFPRMHLLPVGCFHGGGSDFDAARTAAR